MSWGEAVAVGRVGVVGGELSGQLGGGRLGASGPDIWRVGAVAGLELRGSGLALGV